MGKELKMMIAKLTRTPKFMKMMEMMMKRMRNMMKQLIVLTVSKFGFPTKLNLRLMIELTNQTICHRL